MKIKIFSVGGTIDKVYFDQLSDYKVGGPSIREILDGFPLNLEYEIDSFIRKDSLDMTDEDRNLVLEKVQAETCPNILITHGTDTMVETARLLKQVQDKTVVLTGAMEPAGFLHSDAVFNVGCAITAVQTMQPGVYIAMNGRIYDPDKVEKDRNSMRFREI